MAGLFKNSCFEKGVMQLGDPIYGAIAQLGEHLLCKQGVVGSIPTGSTSLNGTRIV